MNELEPKNQLIKMCKETYKENKKNYINITELIRLTNVGIPLIDITWSRTKMSAEHCICVRHTCITTKSFLSTKPELNGHYTGHAKFFLNEDELNLSSSSESKKDSYDKYLSYDKYSNGRTSISSDDSTKCNQTKFKKNSLNSKLKLTNEKGSSFFSGNNLSVYKSDHNLEQNLNSNLFGSKGRKQMIKSNSFNNIINNYKNGTYKCNTENSYYPNNHNTISHLISNCNNSLDLPSIKQQPRFITQFTSVLFLINPYDARISRFETDFVKIAQLNPIRTFIAVATNYTVHTISIRSCRVIATAHLEETIDYICWLTPLIVAIVTSRTVYHWNCNTNQPVIIFFKSPKMYNCQIVNYEADDTMSWFALSSLYLEADEKTITGLVQIHHLNEQMKQQLNGNSHDIESDMNNNNNCFQQCIEAHCVKFARIKFDENNLESTILIAVKKTSTNTIKVYIIELGPLKIQNNQLINRTEVIRFNDTVDGQQIDLPLHNVICFKLGLIYIISKYGRLIICDLQTGIQLNEQQVICEDVVLSAKLDIDNQSIVLIVRNGQVLLIEFDFDNLIKQFTESDTKLKKIAKRILFALNNNSNDEITRL